MSCRAGLRIVPALLLAALAAGHAAGQATVYRCGKDRNEYSSVPCPEGRPVDVGDECSAAQRRQAQAVAQDEQRRADRLADERRRREAEGAQSRAAPGSAASANVTSRSASAPSRTKRAAKPPAGDARSDAAFTARPPPVNDAARPRGR